MSLATATATGNELMKQPTDSDMLTLMHSIVEWRKLSDEITEYKQQVKERSKKVKALETIILRIMKANNMGALDLNKTGGRVLFKKSERKSGLGNKNLQKHLGEYMKSETEALNALEYVQSKREPVIKESLVYQA